MDLREVQHIFNFRGVCEIVWGGVGVRALRDIGVFIALKGVFSKIHRVTHVDGPI